MQKTNSKLEGFNGSKVKPVGYINSRLSVNNCNVNEPVYTIDFCQVPILSRQACINLKLIKRIDLCSEIENGDVFINNNNDVFSGLGEFPDICTIKLKQGAVPKAVPPRRIPLKIKDKLEETLRLLVNKNIIAPVETCLE